MLLSYCNDDFSLSRSTGLLASIPLCKERTVHSGRFLSVVGVFSFFFHLVCVNVFTQQHDEFFDLIRSDPMQSANVWCTSSKRREKKDTEKKTRIHPKCKAFIE